MALMNYNPYAMMSAFDRMDRILGRAGGPVDPDTFVPAVESFSSETELHLRAEIPGVAPQDVHIEVTDGQLCITGERRAPAYAAQSCCCFEEMKYGPFSRCFMIPKNVDREKIRAKNENGILDITIPLPASVKPQEIRIE